MQPSSAGSGASAASVLVTVVLPVFNRASLAVSALESALAQTHSNLEIIVVDDGSTEEMVELADGVAASGSRVRMLRQDNRGPAAARNAGWAAAKGQFVAFLDSDDLFLPGKIETQLRTMLEAGSAFSHTSYLRHSGESLNSMDRIASGSGNAFPDIITRCTIATPTTMLRTDLREDGLAFPEGIRIGEDIALWIKIASRYGVHGIDRALTIVRSSENSAAYDPVKQARGVANILDSVRTNSDLACYRKEIRKLTDLAERLAEQASGKESPSARHRILHVVRKVPGVSRCRRLLAESMKDWMKRLRADMAPGDSAVELTEAAAVLRRAVEAERQWDQRGKVV